MWNSTNCTIEALWKRSPERYIRVRYEDFVADPTASLGPVLDLVGEKASRLPFVGDRTVELKTNHTVSGNPGRFETGRVQLRADEEWKTRMKQADKNAVTALTLPFLFRYGYHGKV